MVVHILMSIWCPDDGQISGQCILCDTFHGYGTYKGTTIYAIDGWDDVSLDCGSGGDCTKDGIMYCGINYSSSCTPINDGTGCEYSSSVCQIGGTEQPTTSSPTTISPITSSPTTISPTTS